MADDDWMRPIRKPLPGPVASEAMQLSPAELARVIAAAHRAGHDAEMHVGHYLDCPRCWVLS